MHHTTYFARRPKEPVTLAMFQMIRHQLAMPMGKRYEEHGLLLRGNGSGSLVLQRDDGGVWRVDADASAWRLIGLRVRVVGVRSDFDLLDVETITSI